MAAADPNSAFGSSHIWEEVIPQPDVTANPKDGRSFGAMAAPILLGLIVPVLLSLALRRRGKKKPSAVVIDVGGDPGLTYRSSRFLSLVDTPWEGATTIPLLFEQTCQNHSSLPLFGTRVFVSKEAVQGADGRSFEKVTLGNYSWVTFAQAFQRVVNFSSGLAAIGHPGRERVAIFAETRAEWMIALQGCLRRSATVVTIYASLGDEALAHSLNETEASTVVCDFRQLKKLIGMSEELKIVKRIIVIEDETSSDSKLPASSGDCSIETFTAVEKLGQAVPEEPDMPKPDDTAVIMYTSGSTGLPKGVVMTHRNLVATVAGMIQQVPFLTYTDVYLAYLPLAHVLELVAEVTICAMGAAIGYGSPLTLTDTSSKIKKGTKGDATALRPTLLTAVPAILDRVRDGVRKTVDAKGGVSKMLFDLAYQRRLSAIEGSMFGAYGLERMLWDAVVFKKIRGVLGGRIRGILSGGAPLSGDTQRFINICLGAPIGQGYGLTETCAGGAFSEWEDRSVGRVGPPVAQCYLKLVDWDEGGYRTTDSPMPRGEIVLGGPSITAGYFKNQEKTEEVYKVDERGVRWFYTGDIGQMHSDGVLQIVDRKKDIVKLQHGEYVSLGKVESVLAGCPYVDSIMLHAHSLQSYTVALVAVKQQALESWANSAGISYTDFKDLCNKGEASKEVVSALTKVAKEGKLQKFEIPTKAKLLPEPWTPESGLVTAAMKIKREVIRKVFSDDLKNLYS